MWLRLSQDTITQYCGSGGLNSMSGSALAVGTAVSTCSNLPVEAWCLQYNQHLGKTLLLPVDEPKSILDQLIRETILRKCSEATAASSGSSTEQSGYVSRIF